MKKIALLKIGAATILAVFALSVSAPAYAGPCEKAVGKFVKCAKDKKDKKTFKAEKKKMIKACKEDTAGVEKVKECVKLKDCVEFHACMNK